MKQPIATAPPPGSQPPSPLLASQRMKTADLREEQGLPARCHMHSEVNGCSWHLLLGWPAALSRFLVPIPSISFGEFTTAPAWKVPPNQSRRFCSRAKAEGVAVPEPLLGG